MYKHYFRKKSRNNSVMYVILNNYFRVKEDKIFIGYNKNTHKKSIKYITDTNEIFYYFNGKKYKIISLLENKQKNFITYYHIMMI